MKCWFGASWCQRGGATVGLSWAPCPQDPLCPGGGRCRQPPRGLCKVLLPNIHIDRLILPPLPPPAPPPKEMKRKKRRKSVMKLQRWCATAWQCRAGGEHSLGQGGKGMPQGSWSPWHSRGGTGPTAQGTEQSQVPASATAPSGHLPRPWLPAGTSASPLQPHRDKTSPGCTVWV